MTFPNARDRYIDEHQQELASVAGLGYRNIGRGAVVVFAESDVTAPDHWSGTVYSYFIQDGLVRRLIHDVWLRNEPARRAEVLAEFIQEVSTYDPSKGMVVVFLSVTGEVRSCRVPFDDSDEKPSPVAA